MAKPDCSYVIEHFARENSVLIAYRFKPELGSYNVVMYDSDDLNNSTRRELSIHVFDNLDTSYCVLISMLREMHKEIQAKKEKKDGQD